MALNNRGTIIGFYFDDQVNPPYPGGQAHGFLLADGLFSVLDVPLAAHTLPLDINDAGQIVGIFSDADGMAQSFLLDAEGWHTFEIPFPGVRLTDLSGINDQGQLVGRYLVSVSDENGTRSFNHGFIATPLTFDATPRPRPRPQAQSRREDTDAADVGTPSPLAPSQATHRLTFQGCAEAAQPPGTMTPAKLQGRARFCTPGE
jgi:hypothetical protein